LKRRLTIAESRARRFDSIQQPNLAKPPHRGEHARRMRTLADRRESRPPGPHLSSCRSGDLAYVRTSAQRLLAVRQVARVDGSPAVCISDDRAYLKAHRKTRRERLVR